MHFLFQIPLSDASKELTTFTKESHKLYHYLWCPQGLHHSPAALAKLTDKVFGHLQFLITYADDMALFGKSKTDYFANLEQFLQFAIHDNIKLNLRKSVLIDDHCTFLCHVIKDGLVKPLQKHKDAISKLEKLCDKSSVKQFLGSLNWLSKYIPCYSKKTHNLHQLLRNTLFVWTKKRERDFQHIKQFLTDNPVLKLPTGAGTYSMYTDGAQTGLGATLLEEIDGQYHAVGYASRTTSEAEKNILLLNWSFKP